MINTFLHLKMCWKQKCYRNFIWRLSATNPPQGLFSLDQKFTEEKKGGGGG